MDLAIALIPFLFPLALLVGLRLAVGKPSISLYDDNSGWWIIGGIASIIVCIGWGIAASVTYIDTLTTVADLEAFQEETLASYEYAIDETKQIVLTDDALTDFSDQAASERIAELRDRIAWYNQSIARLRKFDDIPVVGSIVADLPNDIQPIALPR